MLKNYFKIALRNLKKEKLFSFINVFSLTIGLTCSVLIYLYIQDELGFDKMHDSDNIYRVVQVQNNVDGSMDYKGVFHAIKLGPTIEEEIPGVTSNVRFYRSYQDPEYYIRNRGETFKDKILFADYEVFDIFNLPVVKGFVDKKNINSVVLSESLANKYFGKEDPINKTLSIQLSGEFTDFVVAAVVEDTPSNSSVQFDVLLNFRYLTEVGKLKDNVDSWGYGAIITYVQLDQKADLSLFEEPLKKIMATHYPYYQGTAEQRGYKSAHDYRHFELQALSEVHFDTSVNGGLVASSNILYSYILLGIALSILAIGCINFMNLAIARSTNRTKEIGLRKVIGANRKQLITQFVGESILLSIMAFCLSILLTDILLPVFNSLTDKSIGFNALLNGQSFGILVGLTLLTGLVSGLYPALLLSRTRVREALKNSQKLGKGNFFTQIMVTLQFSIAIALVAGMTVMNKQVQFINNMDLGFRGDQVVVLENSNVGNTTIFSHLRDNAVQHHSIESISAANQNFGVDGLGGMGFEYKGENKRIGIIEVSENYTETLGISVVQGSDFEQQATANKNQLLVNEAGLKDFQLTSGEPFDEFEIPWLGMNEPIVKGVMGDFNYSSLRQEVLPVLIYVTDNQELPYIYLKIKPEEIDQTVAFIESMWKEIAPELPFEYHFLQDNIEQQYASEQRWSAIINYSMIITIILSCMGLLGLVSLALNARRGEIGIRRVLGANVKNIVILFSGNYLKLITIAFVLAVPVSYYFLQEWLMNFAYKTEITVWEYALTALFILIVALVTINVKAIRSAMENPVDALRGE